VGVLGRVGGYGEAQLDDMIRFVAIAGYLGHVPETRDEVRAMRKRAAGWVLRHGTPTIETVSEALDIPVDGNGGERGPERQRRGPDRHD